MQYKTPRLPICAAAGENKYMHRLFSNTMYVFKQHTVCEWYQYLIYNSFHCCNFMTSQPFLKVLTRYFLNLTEWDTDVPTMVSYSNNLSPFVYEWFCDLACISFFACVLLNAHLLVYLVFLIRLSVYY